MIAPPPRRLFVDERGTGFRVSWHDDRRVVVLSVWRDDVCAGTVRLPVEEAASLASFLVGHLAARAVAATPRAEEA